MVAEIELAEESEAVALPDWAGKEVSADPRYRNSRLAQLPFTKWV
jgi:adenylate cyclase